MTSGSVGFKGLEGMERFTPRSNEIMPASRFCLPDIRLQISRELSDWFLKQRNPGPQRRQTKVGCTHFSGKKRQVKQLMVRNSATRVVIGQDSWRVNRDR